MATTTDLEQTGRDANILHNYLDGEPPLRPAVEYGRLGQLILRLIEELGSGTLLQYDGRVDSVGDLPETGQLNHFYLVGPEDAAEFDEYFWVEPEGETGHWDRLGSVAIIIDDHLDTQSTNPVQNSVITLALNGLTVSLATGYDTTGSYVVGSYCTRGQTLYKSNAAQNPAGEWDSSKWDAVTVMGELTSAIAGLATVARTGDYADLLNKPTLATVATSGSYTDLTNKPTIPTVDDRLKSSAVASEYNSSTTYSDGDRFTFEGELYEVDSTADYIKSSNLVTAESKTADGGYINGQAPDLNYPTSDTFKSRWDYRTLGYVEVIPGATYAFTPNGVYSTTGTIGDAFYSAKGTRVSVGSVTGTGQRTYTIASNVHYVRFYLSSENSMPIANVVLQRVYTNMPKVRKITVDSVKQDILTFDSAPTASSNNPVTSDGLKTAFDDVYEAIKEAQDTIIYGFHIDPNESDPKEAVTYLKDAVGMNPASMGSTKFDWGSWKGAFFMPKPCMLKFDGTVDYYLDPNDYSKKLDGTASDVATSTTANAMMEWPKIYFKFEAGELDGEVSFYCSNKKVDETYNCWCNYDANDNVIDHFYTSIYNGIIADSKMRSLSGYRLTPAIGTIAAYDNTKTYTVGSLCKVDGTAYNCITPVTEAEDFDSSKWEEITLSNNGGTTGQAEVDAATANNTTATVEWYTDVFSDRELISALLILMSKCMDDQAAYGRGIDSGSQAAAEAYVTGTLNNKGLFYGVTANGNGAVKVFGMENWYGCKWRRTAGLVGGSNNTYLYKLTYGTADGSTANGYNSSGSNYLTAANVARPGTNNYITKMGAGKHGILPKETAAVSSSLYYGIYYYNGTGYALVGGCSYLGLYVGSLYVLLCYGFSPVHWSFAASLSCKPKKAA